LVFRVVKGKLGEEEETRSRGSTVLVTALGSVLGKLVPCSHNSATDYTQLSFICFIIIYALLTLKPIVPLINGWYTYVGHKY
jgi:hypothetical protein